MKVLAIVLVSVYLFTSEVESRYGKVHVTVFYESADPRCEIFFRSLKPLAEALGDYMETNLNVMTSYGLPDGKPECRPNGYKCRYNFIQSCALDRMKGRSNADRVLMANCFVQGGRDAPEITGPLCSKQFGLDWDDVLKCSEGVEGVKLMKKFEKEEPHRVLDNPTVYVEGKPVGHWNQMKTAVCSEIFKYNLKPKTCDYLYNPWEPGQNKRCFEETEILERIW
ncbi:hypothetical protein GE061_014696 [Apolygus lucorum]|uniref:Uncharacterized protein n=1 Tax=Apolygus lucorum TaxID=248454 RepID=A0A8S9XIY0_APOLU|nr:hypothetical protein GE061_014696 [Apolygus lucorum]